jgi:hypothetical protein
MRVSRSGEPACNFGLTAVTYLGRLLQHVEQRLQSEAARPIGFETEIHSQPIKAGCLDGW